MKKFVLIVIVVLSVAKVWGQNYKVRNINADDAIAGFVEEIVSKNIKPDSHQYEFVLSQNGESFSFEYNVSPDGIKGVAKTDDVWNELEATVLKAIQSIRAELSPKTEPAKQPAKQPEQKPVQQSVQQQAVQQQPIQQQYQQPVQQQIEQQQPIQQYQNQTQPVSYNSSNYSSNMTSQNYSANNNMSGSVSIGGLMRFPDGSQGVVFYLDGQGHGLAVSLDMTTAQWQNADKKKDCLNIAQIPDGDGENVCVVGLGKQYTSTVVSQLGWGKAPAAEWCIRHGDGWYLPSAGELSKLFSTEKETKKMISASLKQCGGAGLADEWHWSSSENDKDEAINVSSSGWTTSEDKIEILHVRAVRAF